VNLRWVGDFWLVFFAGAFVVKSQSECDFKGLYSTCPKLENLQEISETEKQVPLSGKNEEVKPETKAAIPM